MLRIFLDGWGYFRLRQKERFEMDRLFVEMYREECFAQSALLSRFPKVLRTCPHNPKSYLLNFYPHWKKTCNLWIDRKENKIWAWFVALSKLSSDVYLASDALN